MPAAPSLVSLDHAKRWAKRLLAHARQHGPVRQLAQAQEAVAAILGHASWHALVAAHPTAPDRPPPATFDESMVRLIEEINQLHPALHATQVIEMAHDLDLCSDMPEEISRKVRSATNDGEWVGSAVRKAVEDATVTVKAPPGHLWVRVLTQTRRSVLVMLPSPVFARTLVPEDETPPASTTKPKRSGSPR